MLDQKKTVEISKGHKRGKGHEIFGSYRTYGRQAGQTKAAYNLLNGFV